jgi:hypothetical protein
VRINDPFWVQHMAKEVERKLEELMSKGEDIKVGEKELKTLKDRNRLLLDVSCFFNLIHDSPLIMPFLGLELDSTHSLLELIWTTLIKYDIDLYLLAYLLSDIVRHFDL